MDNCVTLCGCRKNEFATIAFDEPMGRWMCTWIRVEIFPILHNPRMFDGIAIQCCLVSDKPLAVESHLASAPSLFLQKLFFL
jgi:hypothetical protein